MRKYQQAAELAAEVDTERARTEDLQKQITARKQVSGVFMVSIWILM